jgi:hypothetical protein
MAPLILTLALEPRAQAYFNDLRQQHFPPERNFLEAHLTLFHHLPADHPDILPTIETLCSGRPPLQLHASKVVSIGKGVAIKIDCPPLQQVHSFLRNQWLSLLTAQDRHGIWPHITIQNKVAPRQAAALLQQLAPAFAPFQFWGIGLTLWEYRGGPWHHLQQFAFSGEELAQNKATL